MSAVGAVRFNGVMGSPADHWPLTTGDDVRDALWGAYADPARGYHDTRHLAEVLTRLAEIADHGATYDQVPVVLAAWFHDAVYDGERDAEERSAAWAEEALPDLTDPPTTAETARLVRLTETHRPADDDANGCALSDADLGILAAPADRYAEYVAAVREEYSHLPDDVFAEGRRAVLTDLLRKPALFHTTYGRQAWEDAARANVEAELARL
jgi:predicted metal-dependent HD superfamily phosphohydrolase